jgi:hypothetical protein
MARSYLHIHERRPVLCSLSLSVECKIWGFHGGDYEEWCLLGCYAVWFLQDPHGVTTQKTPFFERRSWPSLKVHESVVVEEESGLYVLLLPFSLDEWKGAWYACSCFSLRWFRFVLLGWCVGLQRDHVFFCYTNNNKSIPVKALHHHLSI